VKVRAAGVNYADVCIRWGLYTSWNRFGGGRRPSQLAPGAKGDVPGFEFSGIVEAVGSHVTHLSIGDAVFGVSLFGAYSSRILVPAHQVFQIPASLSMASAAAMPCVALTAWFAIQQQATPIRRGAWVLVHSAAGGVGSMLVQMAKIKGWQVVGIVGGGHKVAECTKLGCDVVIDKSNLADGLWAEVRRHVPGGFAAVFDANGVATFADSYTALAPCGKLIVYGFHTMLPKSGGVITPSQWVRMGVQWLRTPRFNPLKMVPENKSVLAFNLSFLFDQGHLLDEAMTELLSWLSSGQLQVPVVTEFALDDVRQAHAALESGSTVGKLVLVPP